MAAKINLNTATFDVLAKLPGVGARVAERIIEYRTKVGRFRTVAELAAVSGISDRTIERFRSRVIVDDESTEAEGEELPPLLEQVRLTQQGNQSYAGHRVTVAFTRREWIADDTGAQVPLSVPASVSAIAPPDGKFTLELPNRSGMSGEVVFRVFSPDGERLHEAKFPAQDLPPEIELAVEPKQYAETAPNEDPGFGRPTRLKGRVIDASGKLQIANRQVVIWAAKNENPGAADYRALVVAQTDKNGYFSGHYPKGAFTSANGTVALKNEPVSVRIHLEEDGSFPESVILVVDADDLPESADDEDCDCEKGDVPRDPDRGDLSRADGTYSTDPGAGRCVDFTRPDRTLEEFTYAYVVRTTEPTIKGLTLKEPAKIDVSRFQHLFPSTKATTMLARADGSDAEARDSNGVREVAAEALATDRIDARILQVLTRDPDGFSLTKVAAAATKTAHADLQRLLGSIVGKLPGRTELDCERFVDWDHEATVYQACTIAHGHVLRFKQEWVADGYSMGNLLYSLPLAPGQKKQIAVVDWERRESSARTEALEESERLDALVSRDRDINEIVSATVSERMRGGSSSSSSSVAGGFGIGAIIPPVGGLLGVGGGHSSAETTAWQDSARNTAANSLNQLRDRTVQSASSLRSQRSTVIQTVRQGERVVATTETVANYNHCHAITIQYFEVLRHLLVRQRLTDVQECLFVPLLMSRFDAAKALRWRNTLRETVRGRLRGGFDALERIDNDYVGSDLPLGSYADQALENLDGSLYLRFQLARPGDSNDDFDANAWLFLSHLFPFISAADFYKQYLKDQALKDKIFQEQMAPRIAERFVQHLRFYAIDQADNRTRLPVDTTLVSDYATDRPLYVSLRLNAALPTLLRKNVKAIEISDQSALLPLPLLQILPTNSKVIVTTGTLNYRTRYSSDALFRNAQVQNDLVGGDVVRIDCPLNRQELRNPRQEDKELARQLLDFLNEDVEGCHHHIWRRMNEHRRFMLLDGFIAPNAGGRSVASVVENELIGIAGNCLILPVARGFHLDPTFRQDAEEPVDLLEHYQPNTPIEPSRIAVPTRGVYAEAVMGACNSCEEKEEQRFWRWEESPLPDQPTPIQPVSTDTRRAEPPDLTGKDFPAPIINLQNAPAAPDPTGLTAALQLIGTPNLFKDITGIEGTQRNAAAALQSAFDTAQFFGGKAADLALQAKMTRDIDKAVKTIDSAKERGLLTDEQAQELTKNAISGMIGAGPKPGEDEKLTAVPEVKQAIARAADTPGGEINVSRATDSGRENLAVRIPSEDSTRSWIIEPADAKVWAKARSFNPNPDGGGDKTGVTKLTVRTRPIPEGGSVRWSVPPDQVGRYTLKGGARLQSGLTADVTGIQPGLTAIDFDVFDAGGKSVESQKYPLCIPQFVSVTAAATFNALLGSYGLIDFEIGQALSATKEVCEKVLRRANVRIIWLMAPFNETLPVQFGAGQPGANMVTTATLLDDSGTPGLLGATFHPEGPAVFNERIELYAGAFEDPAAGNAVERLDDVTSQVIQTLIAAGMTSSAQKDLGMQILGRVYGEALAHEIGHSLIGLNLDSAPGLDHNRHPGISGDLMNLGVDRSFENRSGCSINGSTVTSPLTDSVSLLPGIDAINIPTGTAQAVIDANFPVPPVFR